MGDIIDKISSYAWLALGILGLIGVIACGAWWHLFTVGACLLFYLVSRPEKDAKKARR